MGASRILSSAEIAEARRLIEWGFVEDLGDPPRDLTTDVSLQGDPQASALIVARKAGVVAGLPLLPLLAERFGFRAEALVPDGPVGEETAVARLAGPLRKILAGERLTLNLLCRLSGVATATAAYVRAVAGTQAKICDTRKTTPGWRRLEKYAVRVGGGTNHRLALFDGVLIKDNHLAGIAERESQPIRTAVERARAAVGQGVMLEVEVDSLPQLEEALAAHPDIVLLDNMTVEMLGLAVEMRNLRAPAVLLEASGGVDLRTVGAIARTGVDRISVGAITHSAPAFDLGLDYEAGDDSSR
jgi:nicotinate-nucleotide pyrophosphorylase (carboxylating)